MDFISGLPRSKGADTILDVVDRLSKYAHFCSLAHPYTAKQVAEVFVKEIIRLHGVPKTIVSDRDPLFMSLFWREIFKLQGTALHTNSAYHPESDGKQKSPTGAWKHTYAASLVTNPGSGRLSCPGPNIGSIPIITRLQNTLHSS